MAQEIETPLAYQVYATFGRTIGGRSRHMDDLANADPAMSGLHTVIDLRLGSGVRIMASATPISFASSLLGQAFHAGPYLMSEPQISQEIAIGNTSAQVRSVSVTLAHLVESIDPKIAALRGDFWTGAAEIFLIGDDGEYDERHVMIRGDIDAVSFGAHRELLDITIVDPRPTLDQEIPPWVLSQERWPFLPKRSQGERVPIVINGGNYPIHRLVIGGNDQHMLGVGSGFTVDLIERNQSDVEASPTTSVTLDLQGLNVSTVLCPGSTSDDDAHYATVTMAKQYNVVQTVRELLNRYTGLSGLGLNDDLFGRADARMPALQPPRVVLNESVGALSYVESTLLADYPMLPLVYRGAGIGPVVIDVRGEATARLVVGTGWVLDRVGDVSTTSKSEMSNRFTARYAYDAKKDVWAKVTQRNATNSAMCRASANAIGTRDHQEMELLTVYSDAMAEYIIDWLVEHFARPSFSVSYDCLAEAYIRVQAGDRVSITDAELGWNDAPAIITGLSYERGKCSLTLRVYPPIWSSLSGAN